MMMKKIILIQILLKKAFLIFLNISQMLLL